MIHLECIYIEPIFQCADASMQTFTSLYIYRFAQFATLAHANVRRNFFHYTVQRTESSVCRENGIPSILSLSFFLAPFHPLYCFDSPSPPLHRLHAVGTLIFITAFFHLFQPVFCRAADNNNYSLVQL